MKYGNLINVITFLPDSNDYSRGSGYVVGDRLIITALHNVTNRKQDAVENPGSVTGVAVSQFWGKREEGTISRTPG